MVQIVLCGSKGVKMLRLLNAYEDGFNFVASWYNKFFKEYQLKIKIKAKRPTKEYDFDICRRVFSNIALGTDNDELVIRIHNKRLSLYSVGYIASVDGTRSSFHACIPAHSSFQFQDYQSWSSEETLLNALAIKYDYGWNTPEIWESNAVNPMQEYANNWRKFLKEVGTRKGINNG